ncbi:hypothetical protein CF319_g3173 [Tilletia indica]|nr:hypothetical protein CF319_g3173 [Tilletia indica]
MSVAGSSCVCSARQARRAAASLSRSAASTSQRHHFSSSAESNNTRSTGASSSSSSSSSSTRSFTAEEARARLEAKHREEGKKNPLAAWTPSTNRPMLPLQPRPVNWSHALAAPLYSTPAPASTPRVPLDILTAFDTSSSDAVPPSAAEAASKPSPLIVGPKHTLRHAVRSIELHLGSGPSYSGGRSQSTPNAVGYQSNKTKVTNYQGFTRDAEIREGEEDRSKAEAAVRMHHLREQYGGDYKDHVAHGPLLARLLRNTSDDKKAGEDVLSNVHEAVQVADQALALNPSLGQAAKQFVLHAIQERVDQPQVAAPAPDAAATPSSAADQGSAKKGKRDGKRRAK